MSLEKKALKRNMATEKRFLSKINNLTTKESLLLMKNPLASQDFEIQVNRVVVSGMYKLDKDGHMIPFERKMEKDNFSKLYIKAENRIAVSALKNSSQRLYLHILYELESGVDYIEINIDRFMKENNITSVNTYKTGLDELCRYLFIYPSLVKGVYWINPRLFFCGSRVNKYPENVKIK